MQPLIPHPDFRPSAVTAVDVEVERDYRTWSLTFTVIGVEALALPEPAEPLRTDGLWQTTCFELFVMPAGGNDYYEFNLSPSTQWAAYAFDGYREGMRDWPLPTPVIERNADGLKATLDLAALPGGEWWIGLSAIIVEAGGIKSYWALAHPPGKPDFHHKDGFALQVPAR